MTKLYVIPVINHLTSHKISTFLCFQRQFRVYNTIYISLYTWYIRFKIPYFPTTVTHEISSVYLIRNSQIYYQPLTNVNKDRVI